MLATPAHPALLTYAPLWANLTETDTGCWQWTGRACRGYGRITIKRTTYAVHRLVYELLVAPIPDGLQIDHLCHNRGCVNPEHLDVVTAAVNMSRTSIALRQTCSKGHPLIGDNVHIEPDAHGSHRRCRVCRRQNEIARARRKTHCPRGHELVDENLIIRADGARCCATCRQAMADAAARRRAA